jgi:hypothetical protein
MKVSLSLAVWPVHILDDGFDLSRVDRSEYSVVLSVFGSECINSSI